MHNLLMSSKIVNVTPSAYTGPPVSWAPRGHSRGQSWPCQANSVPQRRGRLCRPISDSGI